MKKLLFPLIFLIYMALCFTTVSAASAKLNGSVTKDIKIGTAITEPFIDITLTEAEVNHFKDSITITLDGANWTCDSSGTITSGVTYEKTAENVIKLHIGDVTVDKTYTISVPIKAVVTKITNVTATINYGFSDVEESKVGFAQGSITRAYLSGAVKSVQTGDIIRAKSGSSVCNNLKIFVNGSDAESTRDKITITLDGAKFEGYDSTGRVSCNKGSIANYYKSADSKTLSITFDSFPVEIKTSGYTLTLPMTARITGTGNIKAIVDFGSSNVDNSEVTFARVSSGTVSAVSENADSPIDTTGTVASVVITDDTLNTYGAKTQIEVALNQVFHFVQVPQIETTGKFEGKCKIELNKTNTQKAIITITSAVDSGDAGTIKIINPSIERSANATNNFSTVEMSFTTSSWSDYNVSCVIAKYQEGANSIAPYVITANANASANKYAALGNIVISDYKGRAYSARSKINLTFDNGYTVFTKGNMPTIKCTGKFENSCEFRVEDNQAYIYITKAISGDSDGTITISGIVLERSSTDAFEDGVKLTVAAEGDSSSSATVQVAKYSSIYDTEPETTTVAETTTEATTDAVSDSSSAQEEKSVKFVIGDVSYTANGVESQLLAAPYIKDGYTMLPMRAIANIVGISDDNISFADGTAVFKISDSIELTVTAGSNEYTVAGQSFEASTSAEIINGTMFLPMRDLAKGIGIADENMLFDGETKEVTLIIGD